MTELPLFSDLIRDPARSCVPEGGGLRAVHATDAKFRARDGSMDDELDLIERAKRDPQAFAALYTIGTDKKDKERPRLGLAKRWKGITPEQRDHLKNVQDHRIDLGEVLVELEMLAP